ncbi:MAG: response regulator [Pseudomonadota bacterium]
MNGVVGMADLLCDSELNEEQRLYANTIKNSGEALLVIINDVLDYSKIEAEKLELHPEPFDLERCVHEVVMLLQPSARDKNLAIAVDYDLFLHTRFIGDPGRFRQVLTNLVGNAVKFTAAGHVLIRVTGVPHDNGHTTVHIAIEDTGIGIPKSKIDHIFGEFNQVEDERNRNFEGTGLGLAITRKLVEMMGGSIWVESDEGVGSCFGFKMEMPHADGAELPSPSVPRKITEALIVDDLEINRTILDKQMALLGIKTTTCTSGAEVLENMHDGIDLVLTDHVMPDMDGLELTESLLEAGWTNAPIVLLSSNPSYVQNDPAGRHLSAILQKPTRRSDLFDLLKRLENRTPEDTAPKAATPTELPPAQDPTGTGQRKMRVLAAEDNRTNQLVFRKMVKDLDIELQFANNGLEAVEAYQSFVPDIIFMDISMPKMDGKTATREIRKLEAGSTRHVPIVAVTAHAMSGDADDILASGLDFYLTKPLRKPDLHARIVEHQPLEALPPVPEAPPAAEAG